MAEKTLKVSPLDNGVFERSEYPRMPKQQIMNSKVLGHPLWVHLPTHESSGCTEVYLFFLSGDTFNLIYKGNNIAVAFIYLFRPVYNYVDKLRKSRE